MDEPLSALDRGTKAEILPFLERLRDRLSLPVVYITHDITEVERLANQIVLMDKGRVIASGPLSELQADPSLPLAKASDAAVSFDGVIEAYDAQYGLLTIAIRGGSLFVPGAARAGRRPSPHPHFRHRCQPCDRSAGAEFDSQRPAGADRLGPTGRRL